MCGCNTPRGGGVVFAHPSQSNGRQNRLRRTGPLDFSYHPRVTAASGLAEVRFFIRMSDSNASATPESTPLVELRHVTCGYGDRIILRDVNLLVPRGRIVALMGVSGGGKTTILRLIGGQLPALKGQVLFDGVDVATLDEAGLYAMRRRMGLLFQFGALFTDLSAFENVAFPLREHTQLSESMIRDLVLMKLNVVGLRGARDLMPAELSGGMARRVALARAIALDPELVMYDEPFTGLDPISTGVAARLIRDLNAALGLTSIVVSHDVEETFAFADEVVFIANGSVVAHGTPDEVRATTDPLVRQFVEAEADGPVKFHYPAVEIGQDLGLERAP